VVEVLRESDGAVVLVLRGEVCLITAPVLGRCIDDVLDAGERHLVIDLGGVTLLAAAGVSAIVAGARRLRAVDGALALRNATDLVGRVVAITGLDCYLEDDAPTGAVPAVAGAAAGPAPGA
jgi:anti-sigma B factor antagonist